MSDCVSYPYDQATLNVCKQTRIGACITDQSQSVRTQVKINIIRGNYFQKKIEYSRLTEWNTPLGLDLVSKALWSPTCQTMG